MGISAGAGAAIAGGLSAGGSLLGGLFGSSGAQAAGKQAAWAQEMAALMAQNRYDTTRGDLLPYNQTGQSMLGPLSTYYQGTQGAVDQAFANAENNIPTIPNQATLLQMPGYQFNLDQGLKATQAQETQKGLGLSGAATKAAQGYATGLANQYLTNYFNMGQQRYADYSQQLANAISGRNTVFQQLSTPASLGENAAAMTGYSGAQLANTTANALAGMGQANAAGTMGSANALSNATQSIANTAGNSLMTYLAYNGGGNYGPYGSSNATDPYNGMAGLSQNTLNTIQSNAASAPSYVPNSGLGAQY